METTAKRYNFFVLAYSSDDHRARLIIQTNDEARAESVLAALNKGCVYLSSKDGDFEYWIVNATNIGGDTAGRVLAVANGPKAQV